MLSDFAAAKERMPRCWIQVFEMVDELNGGGSRLSELPFALSR